jgi:hypothetical protein
MGLSVSRAAFYPFGPAASIFVWTFLADDLVRGREQCQV